MYKSILAFAYFFFILAFSVFANTDVYKEKHQKFIEKNPKDVKFTLHIKDNQTKFQQGEIIPLELKFTSSTPDVYNYLNRTYDRSGRLLLDGFIIDKKDKTFDPLYDYFRRKRNFMMGGLYNIGELSSEPQIMNYDLNEFMSFKETGKYRLYISSPRVSLKKDKESSFSRHFGRDSIPLVSNIVEFEIIPADAEWQKKKFDEAIKIINESSNDKAKRVGCETIRFLGTKEAAKEMILRHSRGKKSCEFQNYIGLYGSPQRQYIVEEMNELLISKDFEVTSKFFWMLLDLDFFLNNPENKKSKEKIFGFETKEEKIIKNAIKLHYLEKLSNAISSKNKDVFSESLETFFIFSAEGERQTHAELTDALSNKFSKLSKRKQYQILQNSWDKLKNPAMLPVLQEIYNSYGDTNLKSTRVTNETFEDIYDRDIFNLTIKGIYELDQNIGKQIILNEIRRPTKRAFTYILELLPKEESSEVVDLLMDKLNRVNIRKSDLDATFSLIDHYQTPELLSKLRQTYADKIDIIECNARQTLLKIFLKSDIEFGAKLLDKAINAKVEKDCVGNILANVIEPYWSPEIEKTVLMTLENDNFNVYNSAVKLLGKYGSADVEENLWKRFERFNREEQSRSDFLEKKEDSNNWQIQIADSDFVVALAESPNRLFKPEQIERLSSLCLYDLCKEKVKELKETSNTGLKIESYFGKRPKLLFSVYKDEENKLFFSINQYKNMSLDSLKKKIKQFPPKTKFIWISNDQNVNDKDHFWKIKNFIEKNNMKLIKQSL